MGVYLVVDKLTHLDEVEVDLTLGLVVERILEHLSQPVASVLRCFVPLFLLCCVAAILFCDLLVKPFITNWLQWSELLVLTLLPSAAELELLARSVKPFDFVEDLWGALVLQICAQAGQHRLLFLSQKANVVVRIQEFTLVMPRFDQA